jgi:hypothetical protein
VDQDNTTTSKTPSTAPVQTMCITTWLPNGGSLVSINVFLFGRDIFLENLENISFPKLGRIAEMRPEKFMLMRVKPRDRGKRIWLELARGRLTGRGDLTSYLKEEHGVVLTSESCVNRWLPIQKMMKDLFILVLLFFWRLVEFAQRVNLVSQAPYCFLCC